LNLNSTIPEYYSMKRFSPAKRQPEAATRNGNQKRQPEAAKSREDPGAGSEKGERCGVKSAKIRKWPGK
jgi:hypothetical protein